jgi:pimeloyl-ACP methyl ester carboxylesterase
VRRDARSMAAELRALLRAAGVAGPFVLVGHSFGWLPVRMFADLYPAETVGLVAVDGSHPDQWARWPTPYADRVLAASQRVTAVLARFGLLQVLDVSASTSAGLPARQAAELRAWSARPGTSRVEAEQIDAWPQSRAQIHAAVPLGDMPLAVLGVSEQPFGAATLTALHLEMGEQGTNTVRRIEQGATHESLVARPEHAAVVADAVRAVAAAHRGARLSEHWRGKGVAREHGCPSPVRAHRRSEPPRRRT